MSEATPCLDENDVSALLSGAIGAAERGAIEEHLDRCPDCRTLVSSVTIALHGPHAESASIGDAPTSSTASLRRGGKLGRYVVLDVVGIGNMGVVYGAYDPNLDRRVAVKVLHEHADRHRVLAWREAKSMARISHPNIVTVHDVGVDGDRVFVAMEFVDGTTLRAWQDASKHPWRETLSRYIEAGRGLAAAHQGGIVHRDFKPDNVLVGKDGWVRVSDLGLAAITELASTHEGDPDVTTGVGTPRYMAPELHDGQEATPKSDQFAFCVSLYEALYGEPPFAGESRNALATAARQQTFRPTPEGSSVPLALRRLVLRGLTAEPTDRHLDMESLVHALRRLWQPRRLPVALGLGATVTVVGLAAALMGGRDDPCPPQSLDTVWSDDARRMLTAQWHAPRRAVERLDAFARSWSAVHRQTCLATRDRRTRTAADLELSGACLEQRRVELEALLDLARGDEGPDAAELMNAIDALVEPSRCRDVESLRAAGSPPAPKYRRQLARAEALIHTGDLSEGRAIANSVVEAAQAEGDAASEAAALLAIAWADAHAGRAEETEATLYEVLARAEQAGQPALRWRAMVLLVFAVGYQQGRNEDGQRWGTLAHALSDRAGVEDIERARLIRYEAVLAGERGDYEASKRLLDDVLRRIEQAERTTHPLYSKTHAELGRTLLGLGANDEAEAAFRQAQHHAVERLGSNNLYVANATQGLADALTRQQRYDEARVELERARQIFRERYGPSDPRLATVELALGRLELRAGDDMKLAEQAFGRAMSSLDSSKRTQSMPYIKAISGLSEVRAHQGRPAEAIQLLEDGIELGDAVTPGHPLVDELRYELGRLHRAHGESQRARALLEASLAAAESDPDRRRSLWVRSLIQLGTMDFETGDAEASAEKLERAAQLAEHEDVDTGVREELRRALEQLRR